MGFETTEREVTRTEIDGIESRLASVESSGGAVLFGEISLGFDGSSGTTYVNLPAIDGFTSTLRLSVERFDDDPSDIVKLALRQGGGGTIFMSGNMNGTLRSKRSVSADPSVNFAGGSVFIADGIFNQSNNFADLKIVVVGAGLTAKCYLTVRGSI